MAYCTKVLVNAALLYKTVLVNALTVQTVLVHALYCTNY